MGNGTTFVETKYQYTRSLERKRRGKGDERKGGFEDPETLQLLIAIPNLSVRGFRLQYFARWLAGWLLKLIKLIAWSSQADLMRCLLGAMEKALKITGHRPPTYMLNASTVERVKSGDGCGCPPLKMDYNYVLPKTMTECYICVWSVCRMTYFESDDGKWRRDERMWGRKEMLNELPPSAWYGYPFDYC